MGRVEREGGRGGRVEDDRGREETLGLYMIKGLVPILGADPYCIVTVEKTRASTPVQKDTLEPKFNSSVLFYVKHPEMADVKIEVSSLAED